MFRTNSLSEGDIYEILSNSRRRETIRHLSAVRDCSVSLRELSVAIATAETGQSPPPQTARESVRSSLHQTHLPKLTELGVVNYDCDTRTVTLRDHARDVDRYMTVITPYGLTWAELYQALGVFSLLTVLASLLEAPLVGAIDPLLWISGSLVAFAVAIATQLWSNRWTVLRALQR
ncbi:hypothetical protein SAMN05421752_11835 [Natronorubrum thiooxidans]|uniref:DUF7344 domain-containing protein n=2 Tax=Natronorubrum thiooxidans TaxID=308853 RepID=A0A1N7GZ07_9EURY|nr:hypothetical protein SAMN05421752_11835 [Natronorubrum thiooxidans]